MSVMIGGKPKNNAQSPSNNNGGILGNRDTSDVIKENRAPKKKAKVAKEK